MPESDFAQALRAWGAAAVVVQGLPDGSRAAAPAASGWLGAKSARTAEDWSASLRAEGFTAFVGAFHEAWSDPLPGVWIAAVAYRSHEDSPGLWVDASMEPPERDDVLHRFFGELSRDGEIGAMGYERFIEIAQPTVVIVRSDRLIEPDHAAGASAPHPPEPSPHTGSPDSASPDGAN